MEAHEAFERFEKSHGSTGHGGGHDADTYGRNAAVVVAIIAAFLAVATFLANEAVKEAIQGQTKVADTNAQVNTLNTQYVVSELDSALLSGISIGNQASAQLQKIASDLDKNITSAVEPQTKKLGETKKEQEKEVAHANDQHLRYELAEVGLQIGIVLASISIIARRHWLLVGGGGMGVVGVIILIVGLVA